MTMKIGKGRREEKWKLEMRERERKRCQQLQICETPKEGRKNGGLE